MIYDICHLKFTTKGAPSPSAYHRPEGPTAPQSLACPCAFLPVFEMLPVLLKPLRLVKA